MMPAQDIKIKCMDQFITIYLENVDDKVLLNVAVL